MIKSVHDYQIDDVFKKDASFFYVIPKYQREYTWTTQHWKDLYDDISENDLGYFIGSIICIDNSVNAYESTPLEVVDEIRMTIDARKGRLRIFKSTLHALGDPERILFLVNPEDRVIAVRAADPNDSRNLSVQVSRYLAPGGDDVDLYCYYLICDLRAAFPEIAGGYSYGLRGYVRDEHRAAFFPIRSCIAIRGNSVPEG